MSDREEASSQEGGEAPRSRFGGGAPAGGGRPGPGGRPAGGRGGPRRGGGGGGRFGGRRKVCGFCVDNIDEVDYKDISRLRRYVSERGKIEPRRKLGTCARHQRSLTVAIKRARHVALLPFTTASR
ncbi:MAG: 30S ribosomal protein S18 [Chloroflexota bacterium]|nr:30S ribosomal protein S18 [Chloroflexota bacterium]